MLTHVNMKRAIDLIVQECRRVRQSLTLCVSSSAAKVVLILPKTMADYARPP